MSDDGLDIVIGTSEAERSDPGASEKHMAAAAAAAELGDRQAELAELRRAVAADPVNCTNMFALAFRLDLMGEDDEAIALYERICEIPPAPINVLINLAVLYEDCGDLPRAERSLRQVLETNPNHARARLFMKDVLASKNMMVSEAPAREALRRDAMLDMPVTDFELSVRTRTCLKKMSIRTLGDLLRHTEAELMSSKNFGDSSLVEIKKMLSMKEMKLGQGLEDAHRVARRKLMEQFKGTGKETLLNKPVSEMNLSVRARKALQMLNIHCLGDLAARTEAELMGVKNFGMTSLVEVNERLTDYGLSLRKLED